MHMPSFFALFIFSPPKDSPLFLHEWWYTSVYVLSCFLTLYRFRCCVRRVSFTFYGSRRMREILIFMVAAVLAFFVVT